MANLTVDEINQRLASEPATIPILPLRDVVVYPHMVIPLFVGRDRSIIALETAMEKDKQVLLLAQKNSGNDAPAIRDLYTTGTLANILQLLKLPDGTVKVLVEGVRRAKVAHFTLSRPYYAAEIVYQDNDPYDSREAEILSRTLISQFEQYVKLNKKLAPELIASIGNIEDPHRLIDTIAAHLMVKIEDKQQVLELTALQDRFERLLVILEAELDLLTVEKRIRVRVKKQMEKNQRDFYLNEQIKAIQKELGEPEDAPNEAQELQEGIKRSGMSGEPKKKALAELGKLKMMQAMSAEATVIRNYLDVLINLPWKKSTRLSHDLAAAEAILEADHFGLERVKERILEYLAVQQRVKKLKGPILCLVGPPGVGKTSLGESIARATNRKYVRMSLGGVRDESEIRGHRRTYIGSMPGKIIQKLTKSGSKNPLFLLDEIDKMASDFRGDPASALLEVLDPEQNVSFSDHYLEVDFDLSEVMFIATSNSMNIPAALLDRMEVIRLTGYTEDEKLNIARRYLLVKEETANGLKKGELVVDDSAILNMIRYYTREAGVRNLQRELAKICRKVVKEILLNKEGTTLPVKVSKDDLQHYLGVQRHRYGLAEESDQVGQVTGLAWTEVGGELLQIETVVVAGKGKQTITGHLGDVMKESIQAAISVVRSRAASLGIATNFYEKQDIHIHVPEGAIPKDGPSAGIGMCTAVISALTQIPVRAEVAMTGEITLRGEVLPIGGLKEKLLAAHRGGIKTVLIPEENRRNLEDVPENVKANLEIIPVRWIDEVIHIALTRMPEPLPQPEVAEVHIDTHEVHHGGVAMPESERLHH
ncbi:MAG: endopeptidase La [Gammaproteobacteria bacterium]|nr:endopeptidase La [Gammaproteobacteria bacterium]